MKDRIEEIFDQVMDSPEPLRRFAELVAADAVAKERERVKQENQRCYVERGEQA